MFTGAGWPMWQVWLLYITTGFFSLALIYYPLRKISRWLLLFILSTIAALMFAPLPITTESSSWAPAALVLLIDLQKKQPGILFRGLFPIVLMWAAFLSLGCAYLLKTRKHHHAKGTQNQTQKVKKLEPEHD